MSLSDTKDRAWPHFQTSERELKMRHAVEYFGEILFVRIADETLFRVFDISS